MLSGHVTRRALLAVSAGALVFCFAAGSAWAQEAVSVEISVKNRRFQPAEIKVPAGKPIRLRIKNLDPNPIEFESVSLRVEKVISGKSEATVNLRALAAGRYNFFDEFHEENKGTLVAQ